MNWIKNTHLALVEFQRFNKTFYWMLWLCVGAIWILQAAVLADHVFVLGALVTLLSGYAALWLCASRWQKLTARIDAADPEPWVVAVNGVRAGDISDAHYASILRTVDFDVRTHISHVLHFSMRLYRLFTHMVCAVPVIVFWAVVLFWLSSPAEFTSTLDSLKTITRSDLIGSLPTLVSLVAMPMALYAGFRLMLRDNSRFAKFDDAIAFRVLSAIGCPATGQVTLSRIRSRGAAGYDLEFENART
jgi:hypothetical protein